MLKTRCENCSRLIICESVKDDGKNFCAYGCRLNWVRAMAASKWAAGARAEVVAHAARPAS